MALAIDTPVPPDDNSWKTQAFRQCLVTKIEEEIQQSGLQFTMTSREIENNIFKKAKTREQYMILTALMIKHFRKKAEQMPQNPPGLAADIMDIIQDLQDFSIL